MKILSAVSCCVFIAVLLLLVGTASAATCTWDGSNSVAWGTKQNWASNTLPVTGNSDNVILTGAGTFSPTSQNINPLSISSLTFDSTTTTAFKVGTVAITLTGTGTALTVASGAAGHTISSPLTLGASQTWSQGSTNPFTISGVISGGAANGITKSGTGTLIFNGTNTYTGATTISAGTLQLGDGTKTGVIIPALNLITDNSILIYNTPSTITHSGVISGTGTFTKSGTGILTLSGTDTYGGTTTVSAGTLQLGDGTKTLNIIPATNLITDNSILIYNTPSTITHSGVISGSGTFTKSGAGILTLSGTNTYTGATTVSAGTLTLGDGITTGNIIPAANLITDTTNLIYNTPSVITHSGVISGLGTFTKSGTGTLTLSGANTYTGTTTVSKGELQFNGVNTGTSAKTVSGGTLSGTGTIPGTVTVANVAGSTLRGGTGSGTSGTLTVNGGLTFSGISSSLDVTSDGTTGLSRVSVGTNTITESSGMIVDLLDPMPAGTYTLISKTTAGLPTTLPTLGMNNSGKIAVFQWASTKGLNVTLTSPTPSLAISLNQSSIYLPLAAGSTATNSSLGITVTSNTPFTVKVADNTARGSHAGSMGSYTSGVYDAAGPTLASPLTLIGTTSGTTAGSMVTGPTAAGSTLYTGGVAVTNQLLAPNTFSQPVVISDPHLLTGSTYKIDLLFTITAN